MKKYVPVALALVLSVSTVGAQSIISADLGSSGTLSSSDVLGAVPAPEWTNPSGFPNFTDADLNFDDGTSSGATLTAAASGGGGGNVDTQVTATTTPDFEMFNRAYRLPSANTSTITLASVPTTGAWAGGYDVYFYVAGVEASPTQYSATDGTTTYQFDLTNGDNFSGTYETITSTDALNPSTSGNTIVFSGLTGASQTFTFEGTDSTNSMGLVGMQVVAVPEPSTTGLLVGALALSLAARRRRR